MVVEIGVKILHVSSGQDIIGNVAYDEVNKEYTVDLPLLPQIRQDPTTGKFQVGLSAVRPYSEDLKKLVVRDAHVVYVIDPAEAMVKIYRNSTSPIIVPSLDLPISSLLK